MILLLRILHRVSTFCVLSILLSTLTTQHVHAAGPPQCPAFGVTNLAPCGIDLVTPNCQFSGLLETCGGPADTIYKTLAGPYQFKSTPVSTDVKYTSEVQPALDPKNAAKVVTNLFNGLIGGLPGVAEGLIGDIFTGVLPCYNSPLGYMVNVYLENLYPQTGIGCKDDRYRNVQIVGPLIQAYACNLGDLQSYSLCKGLSAIDPPVTPQPPLRSYYPQVRGIYQQLNDLVGPGDGTQGAMPNAANNPLGMPHKDTAALPLVYMYPWLYKENDNRQNQQFYIYRGTGNNAYGSISDPEIFEQVLNQTYYGSDDTSGTYDPSTEVFYNFIVDTTWCQAPSMDCDMGPDIPNYHFGVRLSLDSCTNQFILPMGLNPDFVFNEDYRDDAYPWDESMCQPLFTTAPPCKQDLAADHSGNTCIADTGEADKKMYDYRAWGYLELAWWQVLADKYGPAQKNGIGLPNFMTSRGDGQLCLPKPLIGFNQFGSLAGVAAPAGNGTAGTCKIVADFTGFDRTNPGGAPPAPSQFSNAAAYQGNLTTIKQLANRPYERIFDATHPFTPRWDVYTYNPTAAQPPSAGAPPTQTPQVTIIGLLPVPKPVVAAPFLPLPPQFPSTTPTYPPVAPVDGAEPQLGTEHPLTDRYYSVFTYFNFVLNIPNFNLPGLPVLGMPIPGIGYIWPINGITTKLGAWPFAGTPATQWLTPDQLPCSVRCASIPVDILTFRYAEFNQCMMCRINANTKCFWDEWWFNNIWVPSVLTLEGVLVGGGNALGATWSAGGDPPTPPEEIPTGPIYAGGPLPPFNAIASFIRTMESMSPLIEAPQPGLAYDFYNWSNGNHSQGNHGADFRCKTMMSAVPAPPWNPWSNSGQWPPCSVDFDFPFDNHPGIMADQFGFWPNNPYDFGLDLALNFGLFQIPLFVVKPGLHLKCDDCNAQNHDYSDNGAFQSGLTGAPTGITGSSQAYRLSGVTKCCNDLAQPVASVNILKIRNTKLDPTLEDTNGQVAEGYRFSDYFTNLDDQTVHMPFMRWWDTGTAAGGAGGNPLVAAKGGLSGYPGIGGNVNPPWYDPLLGTNYDPLCNTGAYDVIVGMGTESTGKGSPAGLCRYGGTGPIHPEDGHPYAPANPADPAGDYHGHGYRCVAIGTQNSPVDRLTSWEELKQGQMYAMRDFGLNCLPMHEKMWKWTNGEDGALSHAGTHYDSLVSVPNDTTDTRYYYKTNPWPLRWRGYLTDQQNTGPAAGNAYRFPNFDGPVPGASLVGKGLDLAQVGDIIYFYHDDPPGVNPPGAGGNAFATMPFIAVVTGAWHNGTAHDNDPPVVSDDGLTQYVPNASCSDHITVVDVNNGKYPDSCGDTDYAGMGPTRIIWKAWLPPIVTDTLYKNSKEQLTWTDYCHDSHTVVGTGGEANIVNDFGNCMDPKLSNCTFSQTGQKPDYWNEIRVYRPKLDERK